MANSILDKKEFLLPVGRKTDFSEVEGIQFLLIEISRLREMQLKDAWTERSASTERTTQKFQRVEEARMQ